MKKLFIPVCLLLAVSVACDRRPDNVLSDGEMASLLADMHVAEAYVQMNPQEFPSDSVKKVLRQSVLADHGVTQVQLDSTLAWYGRNIDRYTKLYEDIDVILKKKDRAYKVEKGLDTNDNMDESLWPSSQMRFLSPFGDGRGLSFSIPVAGNVMPGDQLTWSFRLVGLHDPAEVFFGVDYDGGKTSYVSREIQMQGRQKFVLQIDTALLPNRIFGYLSIGKKIEYPVWADSIVISKKEFVQDDYGQIYSLKKFSERRERKQHSKIETAKPDTIDTIGAEVYIKENPTAMPRVHSSMPVESMRVNSRK